ncbi:MAG: tyrosine-protein phosphatase [Oribacterium sp.]|nr:tyrosine-protein phosphatase [Oribacterium sp.]
MKYEIKKKNGIRRWVIVCLAFVILLCVAMMALQAEEAKVRDTSDSAPSGAEEELLVIETDILEQNEFGSATLSIGSKELLDAGFSFGDTVDVIFENGSEYIDIPFLNGYYMKRGDPLLLIYRQEAHPFVAINYGRIFEAANLSKGMKVEVRMHEKGKAADIQRLNNLEYSNERTDYAELEDADFANAREITVGKLKPGTLFRSSSPFTNEIGRADYVAAFIEEQGIRTVLDLADDEEKISGYADIPDASQKLLDTGRVILNRMTADYLSEEFETKVAKGLTEMSLREGPYLVQCLEGRDRTGFISALLGALSGADFEELEEDFMLTYKNIFKITKEDAERYDLISSSYFVPMYTAITGTGDRNLSGDEIQQAAQAYMERIGMTKETIEKLKEHLLN